MERSLCWAFRSKPFWCAKVNVPENESQDVTPLEQIYREVGRYSIPIEDEGARYGGRDKDFSIFCPR